MSGAARTCPPLPSKPLTMPISLLSPQRLLIPLLSTTSLLLAACSGNYDHAPSNDLTEAQLERGIQGLQTLVPQLMERSGVPGVAVAVVWNGELRYAQGFGVRETGKPEPITPDTVFQLASVSKSVGATVVATQVDAGVITWDTPVATQLPDFLLAGGGPQPSVGDLYAHRSGLPDHAGDQLEDLGYERDTILHRLRYVPVKQLGSHYAYTNFGLTAAAQAVANAAGTEWATLSERELYQPLGMSRSSSRFADFIAQDNRAIGHSWQDGRYQALYQRQPDAQSPAGGVSSSARDMARWLALLQGMGTSAEGRKLFAPAALEPALVRQSPPGHQYGFGFNVGNDPYGQRLNSHSGAFLLGASTVFMHWPDSALGIVVLTNAAPSGVAEASAISFIELVRNGSTSQDWYTVLHDQFQQEMFQPFGSLAGQTPPATPVQPLPLERYTGTYDNDYYGQASITLDNGTLTLSLGKQGQSSYKLRHWDGSRFVFSLLGENAVEGSVSYLDFTVNPVGNVTGLRTEYFAEDLSGGSFIRSGY